MPRPLWKGKIFMKELGSRLYQNSLITQYTTKLLKNNTLSPAVAYEEDLQIYRRNHVLSSAHLEKIAVVFPFYLFNGYDFFRQTNSMGVPLSMRFLNLGSLISTREPNVTHKTKVSKKAKSTKRPQKPVQKRSAVGGAKISAKIRKMPLAKTYKKTNGARH